jgi:hypothetical protein
MKKKKNRVPIENSVKCTSDALDLFLAFRSDMTNEQKQSMEDAVKAFMDKATLKYVAGQKEHGGNLWEKPDLLDRMEEEVIDQWFYIQAMKQQRRFV